uniref:Uncharacterized protein n=1 Tax=Anguilla anguilla TaxID=7936 RepID=A0A0E9SQT3_ANGAN
MLSRYPSDVSGLTLICPAGLNQPHESEFVKHLRVLEKTPEHPDHPAHTVHV